MQDVAQTRLPFIISSAQPAGTNTGDHMYVRASDSCNQLAMTQALDQTFTRAWSIRIDQVRKLPGGLGH